MSMIDPPGVTTSGGLLLALLPSLGAAPRGSQALLKWAGPGPLAVCQSDLVIAGESSSPLTAVFGLEPGSAFAAQTSIGLVEFRGHGVPSLWQFNGLSVAPPTIDPLQTLVAVWLPLVLSLIDDPHFLIGIVNKGVEPMNLPNLVYESRLAINGQSHPFVDPGHWDGRAELSAGAGTSLRFRFEHFGVSIPTGPAAMSFSCGGWATNPCEVTWRRSDV